MKWSATAFLGVFLGFCSPTIILQCPISAATAGAAVEHQSVTLTVDNQGHPSFYSSTAKAHLLTKPATVRINDDLVHRWAEPSELSVQSADQQEIVDRADPRQELKWTEILSLDRPIAWTILIENLSKRRRELTIEYRFELQLPSDALPFFGAAVAHPQWPDHGVLAYGYYRWDEGVRMTLPLASVYSEHDDVGISFCADLDGPIQPISFIVERRDDGTIEVVVRRRYVRVEPAGRQTSVLHIGLHQGDWRAALGWVRDRWPAAFWIDSQKIEPFQLLRLGGGAPALDVSGEQPYVVDLQYDPWYGYFIPTEHQWHPRIQQYLWNMKQAGLDTQHLANADHNLIERYFVDNGVPDAAVTFSGEDRMLFGIRYHPAPYSVTQDLVRQYIRFLHGQKMKCVWYFCPAEAWGPFMKAAFPEGLVRGPGQTFPTVPVPDGPLEPWYYNWDSYVTNPDPDLPFGKFLLEQVDRLWNQYGEVDGIYIDQPFHSEIDASHDDGLSIVRGRPVANTSYSFDKLMRRIRDSAHERGKIVYCNIPTRIGEARWVDFMLQESQSPLSLRGQQYFGIGNRLGMTMYPFCEVQALDGNTSNERYAQISLAAGYLGMVATSWSGWNAAMEKIGTSPRDAAFCYRPLYVALRGRSWVLEPHCLRLPKDTFGNIFRSKAGNYLVPVVGQDTTSATSWFLYDLPVEINVSDAADLKAVYLLSADHLGAKKISFSRDGNRVRATIPRQRSTSLLVFAKSGHFVSLNSIAISGDARQVGIVLDNWTNQPWRFRGKFSGFLTGDVERTVGAFESQCVELPCNWNEHQLPKEQASLPIWLESQTPGDLPEVRLPDDAEKQAMELFLDDPIRVDVAPPAYAAAGQQATLNLTILSHAPVRERISLSYHADGASVDGPANVVAEPGIAKQIELTIKPQRAGDLQLSVTARSPAVSSECRRTINVSRSTLSDDDFAQIASAWLVLDTFAQDMPGPLPWKLSINDVGQVEMSPDAGTHHGGWRSEVWRSGRVDLPPNMIGAIARDNQIRLSNPNRWASPAAEYGFKVRNVTLGLELQDGSRLSCHAEPGVITSGKAWLHGEGRRLPLEQDLVWDVVIPRTK